MSRALLLPGLDGSGDLFAGFEAELPDEWQIDIVRYATDRACGYDELEAELRAKWLPSDAPPTVAIAESFSGPLAIRLAAEPPTSLRGIVLVSSFTRSPVPRWLARLAAHMPTVPPAIGVRMLMAGLRGDRATVQGVRKAMAKLGPKVAAARLRAVGEVDVSEQLARAKVPVAILRARRDRLVPAGALERGTWPEHVIEGPHLLLQVSPRACAELIVEFVARL